MSVALINQLGEIVREAMPDLTLEAVAAITRHLISPTTVGVTSIRDLASLTLPLMPTDLSPLKQHQLCEALKAAAAAQSTAGNSTQTAGESSQASSSSQASTSSATGSLATTSTAQPHFAQRYPRSRAQPNTFQFKVKWTDLPQSNLERLIQANNQREPANPEDEQALKLALCKKVKSSYLDYREANPGCNLCPGRKVYESLTKQVFCKLGECLKDRVNGKVIGDGTYSFKHRLEVCIENLLRKHSPNANTRKVTAKKGKGTVGVLISEYEPTLAPASKTEQEGIRLHLQNYFKLDILDQDLDDVERDLDRTYELQRADIVNAKEEVLEASDNEGDKDQDSNVTTETAMKKLQKLWPFLFEPEFMRRHHNRLTGRNIYLETERFCETQLVNLELFMTTSSSSNLQNMALRLNADEKAVAGLDVSQQFLLVLFMVANHFKEDITSMVFSAERTLQMDELEVEQEKPCIVAFGQNPILAASYAVCADKTPLMKCRDAREAVTSLFEACFVLDLEYPDLRQTMEFFERFVFGMGFSDTRVQKNGQTVLILSDGVKRLINSLQEFEVKLQVARNRMGD